MVSGASVSTKPPPAVSSVFSQLRAVRKMVARMQAPAFPFSAHPPHLAMAQESRSTASMLPAYNPARKLASVVQHQPIHPGLATNAAAGVCVFDGGKKRSV